MKRLLTGLSKEDPVVPAEFRPVILCRELRCTYTELQKQPVWFIELFELLQQGENVQQKTQAARTNRELKQASQKAKRR